ncbi:hypothetical protein J6590_089671 [Homalodisca vitripennis]|nr:hypothetical protein J6590_089671 [Homalodisca vitripennis]
MRDDTVGLLAVVSRSPRLILLKNMGMSRTNERWHRDAASGSVAFTTSHFAQEYEHESLQREMGPEQSRDRVAKATRPYQICLKLKCTDIQSADSLHTIELGQYVWLTPLVLLRLARLRLT